MIVAKDLRRCTGDDASLTNPISELRRGTPQLAYWVLVCTNQLLLCYI